MHRLSDATGSYGTQTEVVLWTAVQSVPQTSFQSFSQGLSGIGDDLARREIAASDIIVSICGLQNAALECLPPSRHAEASALLRLSTLAQGLLMAAYAHHWEETVRLMSQ